MNKISKTILNIIPSLGDILSEKLLDYFNVPYKTLGSWKTGRGKRTIVVFSKKDAVNSLTLIAEYRRFIEIKNRRNHIMNELLFLGIK